MGGGWSTPPGGRGTPLGHRVVDYGPNAAGAHVPEPHPTAGRRRHCWVRCPDGAAPETELPGLVLDWRRGPDGAWSGFTQYVVEHPDGARAVLEWLPAHRLRPR